MNQKPLAEQLYEALLNCRNLHRQLVEHGVAQRRWYDNTQAQQTSQLVKDAVDRFELERDRSDLHAVSNPVTVVVDVSGGVVQGASSNGPVHVVVLDYDDEGSEPERIFNIPQNDGTMSKAFVSMPDVDKDPAWVHAVNNALLAQGVIY